MAELFAPNTMAIRSAPERILMTADSVGGVWTYALELARVLERHGVQIGLATLGSTLTPEQKREAEQIPNIELFVSAFKLEWMENPWADLEQAAEWLLKLEEEFRPGLVHLNNYAFGSCALKAPRIVVGHSCVWSWWQAVKGEWPGQDWKRYWRVVARSLRNAHAVVAPSRFMLEKLREIYGPFSAEKVIPNGRNPERFQPGAKKPLILAAGRLWDEAKNIADLDRVAGVLRWPVYVAGEENHPAGGTVRYAKACALGRLSCRELAAWLSAASIYVLPAKYEPFGLAAIEAGLSRCALVLGDIPSLREIWDGAAVFVKSGDRKALRSVINGLIMDPGRLGQVADACFQRAKEFSPERMARGYLELYREIVHS